MTSGLYAAAQAMKTRFDAQEIISHNLAGSDTVGFRRRIPVFIGFREVLEAARTGIGSHGTTAVSLDPTHWDFSAGDLRTTGRNLDFAVRGDAFFALETPHGLRLTRNGHFIRAEDGSLTTESGFKVLGEDGPIRVPEGTIAVDATGQLSASGQSAGRLRLVWPSDPRQLFSEGGGLFAVSDPQDLNQPEHAEVVQEALELSNVDMPMEMVAMIENTRMAETISRTMNIVDGTIETAIQNLTR